jgi:chromosome segregation ATPase
MKILKYQQTHSQWLELNLGGLIIMTEEKKVVEDLEYLGSFKEKLLAVSNEIDTIKNSFSRSTEDLSRIQGMLSVKQVDEISGILDKFEERVSEAEKRRTEAADGAKKYSEELEKEKERLIKLWDAYKNQEEELSTTEKKVAEYEERARMAEASKKQIEEDLTARINTLTQQIEENQGKVGRFDEYKQKCEDFDNIRNQFEGEIHALKEDLNNKEITINDLNNQVNELKNMENYQEYKDKYETMTAEYDKEKERLTKLYQLYEETDGECKRLTRENKEWQNWYDSNKDIFNKLFSQSPPIGRTTETPVKEPTSQPTPSDKPIEKKPKKTRRKFKLKK